MIVREMSRQECITFMLAQLLGRLACVKDGQPYVVPITYAFEGGLSLYSFSMPGQKIDWLRVNTSACVQIDEVTDVRRWKSVIVYGQFRELFNNEQCRQESLHAWSLLERRTNWWEPGGLKPQPQPIASASPHIFFAIDIESVTGRLSAEGGQ